MRNSARRSGKYEKKASGPAVESALNRYGAVQRGQFRQASGRQVAIERQVKRILEDAGVMVSLNHFYMNFGKRLEKLRRTYSGSILATETCIEFRRWLSRGLDFTVLNSVVSSLGLPECPPPGEFIYTYGTGAGVDRWAYWYEAGGICLTAPAPPFGTEFTAPQYAAIAASDDTWAGNPNLSGCSINLFKFVFPYPSKFVTSIDWLHEGHAGGVPILVQCLGEAYNFNTSSWTSIWTAGNEFADVTHSGTIAASPGDYLGPSGEFYLAAIYSTILPLETSQAFTDYVRFQVHV